MNLYLPEGAMRSAASGRSHQAISLHYLQYAMEAQKILEAPVALCDSQMNLHIPLGGFHGIIPRNEVAFSVTDEQTKDIAILTRVGKSVCFKVTGIDMGASPPTVYLSRKEAQRECYQDYIRLLSPGDVVMARVTHMESFGAFLDVGCGITALLTVDCLSVSRISHPKFRMSIGDEIAVIIKSIDEYGRIYVTRKELLGTWEENAALFSVGQTVPGTVRSIESYGIFIELTPNLAGLAEPREEIEPNASAVVFIKNIIPERMKIKLIIIDVAPGKAKRSIPDKDMVFATDGAKHIDSWLYSPPSADKRIETVF